MKYCVDKSDEKKIVYVILQEDKEIAYVKALEEAKRRAFTKAKTDASRYQRCTVSICKILVSWRKRNSQLFLW